MAVQSYRDLEVWSKGMELAEEIYEATKQFPGEEQDGLTRQLQRTADSVPSNIAEGQGRNWTREFLHHLSIAYGSLWEVEPQLILAERFGYVSSDRARSVNPLCQSTGKMLNGLMRSLRNKLATEHRTPPTDH